MIDRGGKPWKLTMFPEALNVWIDVCSPGSGLRRVVRTWVVTRYDDPYDGMQREPGFDNLWSGVIPGTLDFDERDTVVACSYFIEESTRTVRCDNFGTLSWPL